MTDMSVEGIFRKNGNIRRLRELTEAIDRDPSSVDLTQDNPVQLAALLKKFLRDLPDPLMTYKLHRLFVSSQCELSAAPFGKITTHVCLYPQHFQQMRNGNGICIWFPYYCQKVIETRWKSYSFS